MVSPKKKSKAHILATPAGADNMAGKKSCICGHGCHDKHASLPAYLLIGFGLLGLPINFGFVEEFSWLQAWPLFLVLLGVVFLVRVVFCKAKSK